MQKRILYIGDQLKKGSGLTTTIDSLTLLLRGAGYRVTTGSHYKNKVLRLLDMLYKTVANRKKVDLVLIDTYSTQNFYYAVCIAKLCRFFKLPYIPILHGGNLPERLKSSPKMSQNLFKGAKINISPSMYLMNAFKEEGYTNLSYIPNTIELKNYPFLLRKNLKAKLFWLRSFSKIYNPLLALEIVEGLLKKNIDVSLCMVGPEKDGTLAECKKIAKQKNLPISFPGKLEKKDWISLSKEYDIFINTTNFDNMPVSVIEAMALGLPVISTNVGGLPYLIDHENNGLLVPPNDPQVFVDEILKLLENSQLGEQLAVNARKKVEAFDWEQVKELWSEVLNET